MMIDLGTLGRRRGWTTPGRSAPGRYQKRGGRGARVGAMGGEVISALRVISCFVFLVNHRIRAFPSSWMSPSIVHAP